MSLDVSLYVTRPVEIYSANITHNLGSMARDACLYAVLWRPEELGLSKAMELIPLLQAGLALLKSDPARFKAFDSPNGWGTYEHFVPFVEEYLEACIANPDADVSVCR